MKKWKWLIGFFLLAFLVFFPKIASTALGKPFFVKALEKKIGIQLEVSSLKLSWLGPQMFQGVHFQKEGVLGSFEKLEIDAPFWSFSGPFHLKNGQIAYRGREVKEIQGQIIGNDFTLNGITLNGHLALKGKIYSKLHFHLQLDIQQFPLVVIDPTLDEIFGPTLDLLGTVGMDQGEGRIDLLVTAPNAKAHIQGILKETGISLSDPVDVQIRLTPAMSKLLFKDANPLFITGLSANHPVTLRLEPSDFFFPLPYSLEKLQVGKATLNLGKVVCQNGASLKIIMAILKATPRLNGDEMNAWFTPITFQIKQGILKTGRLDALLGDSVHVCTWGRIDLLNDKLHMNLGIPADTLARAFGIKDLPPNYVLKIPFRGTTQHPDINKGSAAAKITALIAASKIKGFSNFIIKKEPTDIPPPQLPFPWDKP